MLNWRISVCIQQFTNSYQNSYITVSHPAMHIFSLLSKLPRTKFFQKFWILFVTLAERKGISKFSQILDMIFRIRISSISVYNNMGHNNSIISFSRCANRRKINHEIMPVTGNSTHAQRFGLTRAILRARWPGFWNAN